jgi:hypothetical protein
MISMAYDQDCETVHFVWRNIRFAFVGFGRIGVGTEASDARTVMNSLSRGGGRFRDELRAQLHERAVKPLESLVSVNLCAQAAGGRETVRSPSGLTYQDSPVDWFCISQIQHRARGLGGLAFEGRDDKSHVFVWPRNIRRIQQKTAPHSRAQTSMQSKQR